MLITFRTPVYSDITLFGDIGKSFIRHMGHSGKVPGALDKEDVPKALDNLRAAISAQEAVVSSTVAPGEEVEEGDEPVPVRQRAFPLLQLLAAAAAAGEYVSWEES
jgi:hypothetical protein